MQLKKLKGWAPLTWPTWQKLVFFGVLLWFWLAGAIFSYRIGNTSYFHTDSSTEGMTIFAGTHYLEHGFFENYLLPTYPPFGHDPSGKPRTEPFVYNHYLAGPDIIMALVLKVFGRDNMWMDRLVPHTLTVVAMAVLCAEFAVFSGASLMGLILLGLLLIPRSLVAWSICMYGHSYVMAFYLLLIAGILGLVNRSKAPARKAARNAWVLGIFVGFMQMAFDLDWEPLTFVSAASTIVLLPQLQWKQGRRVLLGLVVGGTVALCYQLFISSLYYGSFMWVVENMRDWIFFRAGAVHIEGQTMGDLRLSRILQEYNRQCYGATGLTAFNLMALSAAFLVMGLLGRVKTVATFGRGLWSVLLAYLAAAIWNIFMRQHSVAHIHYLPRHYIVLYINFMLVALPVAQALVERSRKLKPAMADL